MILTLTLDNYRNATLDVKLVDGIQLVMRGPRGGSSRSIVLTPAAARTVAIQLLALAEEIKPEADYATGAEIDEARRLYGRDGEVEIDEDAKASRGDDDGCYIAAWVWVPFNESGSGDGIAIPLERAQDFIERLARDKGDDDGDC